MRAINAGLFDAYLLKSLDSVAIGPVAAGNIMVRCGVEHKQVCVFVKAGAATTDLTIEHQMVVVSDCMLLL